MGIVRSAIARPKPQTEHWGVSVGPGLSVGDVVGTGSGDAVTTGLGVGGVEGGCIGPKSSDSLGAGDPVGLRVLNAPASQRQPKLASANV